MSILILTRDLGAGYLAGKALVRNAERNALTKRSYVETFTDAFATGAMVLGTLLVPNVSGPVGLAVAGHDIYRNRAELKAQALKAKAWIAQRLPKRKAKLTVSNVTPITRKPRAKRTTTSTKGA